MELSTKKPFFTPKDLSWHERAKWWKDKGKRVLGYLCSDFPEEIVYAGGILPIRILGSNEAISEAYKYSVNPYSCYVTRSILDMALKGELSDFDGLAITTTCDACGLDIYWRMEDQVKGSFPFLYLLPRPSISKTESSHKFFRVELLRLKESLEEFLQEEIPKSSLSQAIKVYNQNRSLLREIYNLRGEGFISGVDAASAVFSSMGNPKDENNLLLSRMIEEAKVREPKTSAAPRIHLSGSVLFNLELFELIEDLGGTVVSDDLCVGSRYFWDPVSADRDPLEALATRYLDKEPACPCMNTEGKVEDRLNFILMMLERYKADAVVFCLHKYCDTHQLDYQILAEELEEREIPFLVHIIEQNIGVAQLRTKLEALFEIINGRG